MSLAQFLSTGKQEVEAALERILPKVEGDGAVLFESMRYGVFAGGKRLRPCLFLATVDTFGGDRAAHQRQALIPGKHGTLAAFAARCMSAEKQCKCAGARA